MALDRDAEHVPGLALVPVRGRPDGDHARNGLPVVAPDLDPEPPRRRAEREEVVGDREALRLRLGRRSSPWEPGAFMSRAGGVQPRSAGDGGEPQ